MVGLLVRNICNPHRSVPHCTTYETVRRTVKETGSFPQANAVRGQLRRRGVDVLAAVQGTYVQAETPVRLVYRGYRYGEFCTMMVHARITVKEYNAFYQEIA